MPWLQNLTWLGVKWMIRHQFPHVLSISTRSLADWVAQPEAERPILLDVRPCEEYAVSHLQNARQIDPGQQDFHGLGIDPQQPIVTYCSVGYRSAALADRLQAAGYTQVRNLEGSIFQWANEGRPVYRQGQPVAEVHPYNDRWGKLLNPELHAFQPPA